MILLLYIQASAWCLAPGPWLSFLIQDALAAPGHPWPALGTHRSLNKVPVGNDPSHVANREFRAAACSVHS